jgi:LPS O-antigen subunit length determinant protein (WzzB/FepE family)
MRRRFFWREITAQESAQWMNLSEDIKKRMGQLNNAIENAKDEGLGKSYQIGGAYFLDDKGAQSQDFDGIWENRIKPLILEYLRGTTGDIEKFKKAYEDISN